MAQDLDQLDASVAHVKIRPDQDIGFSGHFAFPLHFLSGNSGNNGCIQLEFTVQLKIRPLLLSDLYGVFDLIDQYALAAAVG